MRPWREILDDRRYHRTSALVVAAAGKLGLKYCPAAVFEEGLHRLRGIEIPEPEGPFEVRPIAPADLPSIANLPIRRIPIHVLEDRLAGGMGGLSVRLNDVLVGSMWWDLKAMTWFDKTVTMASDQACLWDAIILREFRGRGLAPWLRLLSYRILLEREGRRRLFSVSHTTNLPSLRYKWKLGALELCRWWHLRLFGRKVAAHCPWPPPAFDPDGDTDARDSTGPVNP